MNRKGATCFIAQNKGAFKHLPMKSLNIKWHHIIHLMCLLMKREKSLQKKEIRILSKKAFFGVHCGRYGRHGEYLHDPTHLFPNLTSSMRILQIRLSDLIQRHIIQQYLSGFHSLDILSCLDLTGYYQYKSINLPIYFFLRSRGIDLQFDTKIREYRIDGQPKSSRLDVSQNGLDFKKTIGPRDIVICTSGSTVSGSKIGTNDLPPARHSICARKSEHMLESFTITTEDIRLIKLNMFSLYRDARLRLVQSFI
ncbi:hypothetical protein N7516_005900 [Penicillium verrucosum]|uniref:uncharacterized protein n=1 Tax=Penicillium verrucosum TaxID=60171 RepID=UPI0025455696|nr:uncharacterized protein N7516_005900 [Penicillium verrucosum]KAJ5931411.1 hypothetical protein N7516_005900 [Penicillium verrucosum]